MLMKYRKMVESVLWKYSPFCENICHPSEISYSKIPLSLKNQLIPKLSHTHDNYRIDFLSNYIRCISAVIWKYGLCFTTELRLALTDEVTESRPWYQFRSTKVPLPTFLVCLRPTQVKVRFLSLSVLCI